MAICRMSLSLHFTPGVLRYIKKHPLEIQPRMATILPRRVACNLAWLSIMTNSTKQSSGITTLHETSGSCV